MSNNLGVSQNPNGFDTNNHKIINGDLNWLAAMRPLI